MEHQVRGVDHAMGQKATLVAYAIGTGNLDENLYIAPHGENGCKKCRIINSQNFRSRKKQK